MATIPKDATAHSLSENGFGRAWILYKIEVLQSSIRHREPVNFPFTREQMEQLSIDDLTAIHDGLLELSRIPPKGR